MSNLFCLVLVPAERTPDSQGNSVDYGLVYEAVLKPAISAAGLQPFRATEELRLWNQDGLHGFGDLPSKYLSGSSLAVARARHKITEGLRRYEQPPADWVPVAPAPAPAPAPPGPGRNSADTRRELALARRQSSPVAVQSVLREFRLSGQEPDPDVLLDAMLSYRVMKAWRVMVEHIDGMPPEIGLTAEVQEQKAYALNQDGHGAEAEQTLLELMRARGESLATLELLGWVYRTGWEYALNMDQPREAQALLKNAIDAYVRGFLLDPRNALTSAGNAITLMEVSERPDDRKEKLLPVARNLAQLRVDTLTAGYWEHATLLQLAAIERDAPQVASALAGALDSRHEPWQLEETAKNLWLVHQTRQRRSVEFPPALEATWELRKRAAMGLPLPQ